MFLDGKPQENFDLMSSDVGIALMVEPIAFDVEIAIYHQVFVKFEQ